MNLDIHDSANPIDDDLREYAAHRLQGLAEHAPLITTAEVEFCHGPTRDLAPTQLVRIVLHLESPSPAVRVHSFASNPRAAFEVALVHLSQQLLHLQAPT